jgi:hypothetical protein
VEKKKEGRGEWGNGREEADGEDGKVKIREENTNSSTTL